MKSKMRLLAATLLVAATPLAIAQTTGGTATAAPNAGQALVAAKIASNFATLAGSTDLGVGTRLVALKPPGVRWHYRLVARSSAGISVGADACMEVLGCVFCLRPISPLTPRRPVT